LLDWFEVDLGFTELLFIQIDLCVMCVFVLYSPGESREICTDAVEHNVERVTHTHTHTHTHTRASCTHGSCHTYE